MCRTTAKSNASKETAGDGRLSAPQKVSATPLIFTTLLGIWILEKKYCCSSRRKDVVESFGNLPSSCVALSCRIKSEDCAWKIMTGQSEIGCDYVADESPDLWQVDLQEYRSGFASILNLHVAGRDFARPKSIPNSSRANTFKTIWFLHPFQKTNDAQIDSNLHMATIFLRYGLH